MATFGYTLMCEHAILQAGRDQDGFFGFWNEELKPGLEKIGLAARREAAASVAPRN